MRLSPEGLAFLSHEEGLKTSVYQDAKGLDTIGVGHLITDAETQLVARPLALVIASFKGIWQTVRGTSGS